MEIKSKRKIKELSEFLGVSAERVDKIKILSSEEQKKQINDLVESNMYELVFNYFKKVIMTRVELEIKAAKVLAIENKYILESLIKIKKDIEDIEKEKRELPYFFKIAEQLGATSYACFVAANFSSTIQSRLSSAENLNIDKEELIYHAKTDRDQEFEIFINKYIKNKND